MGERVDHGGPDYPLSIHPCNCRHFSSPRRTILVTVVTLQVSGAQSSRQLHKSCTQCLKSNNSYTKGKPQSIHPCNCRHCSGPRLVNLHDRRCEFERHARLVWPGTPPAAQRRRTRGCDQARCQIGEDRQRCPDRSVVARPGQYGSRSLVLSSLPSDRLCRDTVN